MSEVVFKITYAIIPYMLGFLFIVTIVGIIKIVLSNAKNKIISYITNEKCPNCGGNLVNKKGKYGYFIGCSNYPECRYTRSV